MQIPQKKKVSLNRLFKDSKNSLKKTALSISLASVALFSFPSNSHASEIPDLNQDNNSQKEDSGSKAFVMAQPKNLMEAADHYSHESHESHSSHYSSS